MSIFDIGNSSGGQDVVDRVIEENRNEPVPDFSSSHVLKFPLDAAHWVGLNMMNIESRDRDDPDGRRVRLSGRVLVERFAQAYIAVELGLRTGLALAARGFDLLKEGEKHCVGYSMAMSMAMEVKESDHEAFASECIASLIAVARTAEANPNLIKSSIVQMLEAQKGLDED